MTKSSEKNSENINRNNKLLLPSNTNNSSSFPQYDCWHSLFNQVCEMGGFENTYKLAELICVETKKSSQKDMEAIARNICNWRNGSHTPHRKNFRILTNVLSIDQNKELFSTWNDLYSKESSRLKRKSRSVNYQTASHSRLDRHWNTNNMLSGIAFGILLTLTFVAAYHFIFDQTYQKQTSSTWQNNVILWRKQASLKVGTQIVVHGYRGECGQSPSFSKQTNYSLPTLKLGTLIIGNLGIRASQKCNGNTPAREVIFKAEHPGTETFSIFGDKITITVLK